jgi:predicted permease
MDWLPDIFRRSRVYDELSEEIRLHIEERIEQLLREGMSPEDAAREARRAFGNRTLLEERSREVWQWPTLESMWVDARFALRQLRKSPGFALAAVLTLALAIGANAVVFGILNALFLRPLTVPHPESLYGIEHGPDKSGNESYLDYRDIRDRNRSFEDMALYRIADAGLDTGRNPSEVWGYEVSGNYFDALGIQPFLGRFFHSADEHGPNSAPYLVISYPYWHDHFQDDRSVVGRVVQLNKHPVTILGVTPREFRGTLLFFFPDFWFPAINHEQLTGMNILNDRGNRSFFMAFGHLKSGVAPAQAVSDLNSVGSYLEKSYPKDDAHLTFTLARPALAGDSLGPPAQGFVTGLMLLSGLILLAACANLGSLFAARAADRSREVALRLALGASRKRILRAVFTEAVLISLVGGGVGLMGSIALLRALSVWRPIPMYPIYVPVSADANVAWVALALALASGFLFGAVPMKQILRTNPYEVVKAGSTGTVAGAGRTGRRITVRDVLLVAQIAICAVLVTSSLVAVRGLLQSMHANFGFEPRNTMLVDTNLTMDGYSGDRASEMQRRMIHALETIPGVNSVGFVNAAPLSGGYNSDEVYTDETTELRPANAAADAKMYSISPDYFHASGTSLLQGRALSWHDDKSAPRVAVVNEEFARRLFGSVTDAVGRYYKLDDGTRVEVVGIAEDGKYYQLTESQQPAMFLPFLQLPSSTTCLVVRSDRDPQQLAVDIRRRLRDLDAGLPFEIHTWAEVLSVALFAPRVATVALGVLGGMGAMLAITGIFGLAAYSVSKRLRELGIRVALGAQRHEVLQAALARPLKLLMTGSAAGLLLGVLATRGLAYIVYQANPRDPLVLGGVVLAMSLLGLLATWIPAQRALSVDPLILLHED